MPLNIYLKPPKYFTFVYIITHGIINAEFIEKEKFMIWWPILLGVMILTWGIYWSMPHDKKNNSPKSTVMNWEKFGVYLAAIAVFFTLITYIIEMKVAIAKLEVKMEKLEK